jgi:hypothetical protein
MTNKSATFRYSNRLLLKENTGPAIRGLPQVTLAKARETELVHAQMVTIRRYLRDKHFSRRHASTTARKEKLLIVRCNNSVCTMKRNLLGMKTECPLEP